MLCHTGPHREAPGSARRQREWETSEQGEGHLSNHLSGFLGRTVGPWESRVGRRWPGVWEPIEEVAGCRVTCLLISFC